LRGQNLSEVDYDFSIEFGDLPDTKAGSCSFATSSIMIDKKSWQGRDQPEREHLIFHELGHCILQRHHRNEDSSSNECFSYLRGSEQDFSCSLNLYSAYWREYYLDELFDPTITLPEWHQTNQDYTKTNMSYDSSFVINDTVEAVLRIYNFKFDQQDTFLFEMTFNNFNVDVPYVSFRLGDLRFAHCDTCTEFKTTLHQLGDSWIYNSSDIDANTDVKLSIFKNKDVVSFYVNEYFVHAMEYTIINGNWFETVSNNGPKKMSVRYLFN